MPHVQPQVGSTDGDRESDQRGGGQVRVHELFEIVGEESGAVGLAPGTLEKVLLGEGERARPRAYLNDDRVSQRSQVRAGEPFPAARREQATQRYPCNEHEVRRQRDQRQPFKQHAARPWRDDSIVPRTVLLAHGWRLEVSGEIPAALVRDYFRPAVRAVPAAMAVRTRIRRVFVAPTLDDPGAASRWRRGPEGAEVWVAAEGDPHDATMELLLCVGQILWQETGDEERRRWLELLRAEIEAGVSGEIDERTLEAKARLLTNPAAARSIRRLQEYARESFASTAAEYVHCLWHDVTIRTGPEHLPAPCLRARLELFRRWFPPNPGYRLYAAQPQRGTGSGGASEASPA